MPNLEEIKIEGYKLDKSISSLDGRICYVCATNEDDFVDILIATNCSGGEDMIVATIFSGCQCVKTVCFSLDEKFENISQTIEQIVLKKC